MRDTARILLLGFDSVDGLARRVRGLGFEPVVGATLAEALAAVESCEPPLCVGLLPPDPCLEDLPQTLQLLRERSLHGALRLLAVGLRPDASQVARLRGAGVGLACWEPFSDGELRFTLNHLLHASWKTDSRADPRVPTTLEAHVHGGASESPAPVYSLSAGGAFLETERPSPVGEEVFVELPLPARARTIQARVVSNRAERDGGCLPSGMGVRFLEMDDATLEALAEYVEGQSRRFQIDAGAGSTSAMARGSSTPSADGPVTEETAPVRVPLIRRLQPERRTGERVGMRFPVRYETELWERSARLLDLSWRGCRILTTEEQEPDAAITVWLPKELMQDDSPLPLPGWVLRCEPDPGDAEWPISLAVVFDELTEESSARLSAALGMTLEDPVPGPASAAANEDAKPASASQRTSPPGVGAVGLPATFGRYLLDRGLLSRSQLEDVTRSMVVFGGRLGTHLVESGVLETDALEAHLATHLGVRAAPIERIESPHPEALEAIPRSLIRRCKVFPFDLGSDTLHVAMRDPRDERVCEELARATGLSIEPYLVSEVRLFADLEHHFGLDRHLRYAKSRLSPAAGCSPEADPPLILLEELADVDDESDELPFSPLAEGEELIDDAAFAQVYRGGAPSKSALPVGQDEEASSGPAEGGAQRPEGLDAGSVARLERALERAGDRQEVHRYALEIARAHARSVALFLVREVIEGVAAAGEVERSDLRGVLVPLEGASMLATAARTGELVRGAPASSGVDQQLLRFVRGGEVREVAFIPVTIRGRVVNVLSVDNGPEEIAGSSLAALLALCERIGESYERIILERKDRI